MVSNFVGFQLLERKADRYFHQCPCNATATLMRTAIPAFTNRSITVRRTSFRSSSTILSSASVIRPGCPLPHQHVHLGFHPAQLFQHVVLKMSVNHPQH